jgi:hypothetical protein
MAGITKQSKLITSRADIHQTLPSQVGLSAEFLIENVPKKAELWSG